MKIILSKRIVAKSGLWLLQKKMVGASSQSENPISGWRISASISTVNPPDDFHSLDILQLSGQYPADIRCPDIEFLTQPIELQDGKFSNQWPRAPVCPLRYQCNITTEEDRTKQRCLGPSGGRCCLYHHIFNSFQGPKLVNRSGCGYICRIPAFLRSFFPNSCTFFEISGAESKILPVDIRLISLNPRSSSSVALKRRMEDWGDDPLDIHRRDSALAHPLYWGHDK